MLHFQRSLRLRRGGPALPPHLPGALWLLPRREAGAGGSFRALRRGGFRGELRVVQLLELLRFLGHCDKQLEDVQLLMRELDENERERYA